jgi:hypothetical protein
LPGWLDRLYDTLIKISGAAAAMVLIEQNVERGTQTDQPASV